jgi:hypothetical protein
MLNILSIFQAAMLNFLPFIGTALRFALVWFGLVWCDLGSHLGFNVLGSMWA